MVIVGVVLVAAPGVDAARDAKSVQLPHELRVEFSLILGGELRPLGQGVVEDRGIRPGDEQAGGVALLVPLDFPAGRLGRVLRVADGPQRRPVQQSPVVQVQDEDWRVGAAALISSRRRHPPLGELELAPAAHDANPLRRRGAPGLLPEHPQGVGQDGTPSQRSSMLKLSPPRIRCVWESFRPGTSALAGSGRSTVVRGPRKCITSLLVGADAEDAAAPDGDGRRDRVAPGPES